MNLADLKKLKERVDAEIAKAQYQIATLQARESLIDYVKFTMPHNKAPDDATKTAYEVKEFHAAAARALEAIERRESKRLIICMPPRMGKSELASRRFIPWCMGRDPTRNIIFGTYNQPFADDFGKKIRRIMLSKRHLEAFPDARLAQGEKSSEYLGLEAGGQIAFVGRGGSTTGRGAHIFLVDDPIKDREEAKSPARRDECWDWFQDVVTTRMMDDQSAIILIMTRWHDDDIVGRITDPENPHYNAEYAAEWKIIKLTALAEEDDVLGRALGQSMWPEKFSTEYFEKLRASMPRTFSALYQQRPAPLDGNLFKAEWVKTFKSPSDIPKLETLRTYAAVDLAVGTKEINDRTCMIVVGLDLHKTMWILDCVWTRMKSTESVSAMFALQAKWDPLQWFIEKGQMTKSIGPFLQERMQREHKFLNVVEVGVAGDKVKKAQPIMAHMGLGGVRFPAYAPWYERAYTELMKFDTAPHDDFVDTLALFGQKLNFTVKGREAQEAPKASVSGSYGWYREQEKLMKRRFSTDSVRAMA